MTIYELEARYDSRKSFYGKAHVIDHGRGYYELQSYDTIVSKCRDGITFRPQECNPYYYTYWIARAADFERADQLNRISRAYLEGFWQAIHDHGDAALAIEAGHAAIQAAGISA